MDRFEEKLKDSLTKKIKLPNEYKYIIRNALYKENEEKRRRHRFIKILAMSCTFLLLITSVVGAVNLSRYIYNYYSDNKGMDEAIKEGYIDESNMEYVASSNVEEIEALNTEIKIKDMLMDDHNLSFTFSVKFAFIFSLLISSVILCGTKVNIQFLLIQSG